MGITRASRYHDISCGHRVVGQGGKCEHLHGHNYRIHFHVEGNLDAVGRVLDFSVIKSELCEWIENVWDHMFLVWEEDPYLPGLRAVDPYGLSIVPFNPTAENMAEYLVTVVGPALLIPYDCTLVACEVEETSKCFASYRLG